MDETLIDTVYACVIAWRGKMAVLADSLDSKFDYENKTEVLPLRSYTERQVLDACLILTDRNLLKRKNRPIGDPCIRFVVLTPHEIVEMKCKKH